MTLEPLPRRPALSWWTRWRRLREHALRVVTPPADRRSLAADVSAIELAGSGLLAPGWAALSRTIAEHGLDEGRFDSAAVAALAEMVAAVGTGTQPEYLARHRRRFIEMAGIIAALQREGRLPPAPRLLDVGGSVNTLILRRLFPAATVEMADAPGYAFPEALGLGQHAVDLEVPDLDARDLGTRYDFILFGEVLEHLLAHPRRVFAFLLRHLAPGGLLLVTTPNFFGRHGLAMLQRGRNPAPLFPETADPSQRHHHHVREYSMLELVEWLDRAGGRTEALLYSDCWDEVQRGAFATNDCEERANLVVLASRADQPKRIVG
ncbi:MAG: class I SAM-dependent methyltransferase [Acetobacteraceae bacterium]|nr:class I SAM-dependent methyltransferase [Acetobacteraceae bacterium]